MPGRLKKKPDHFFEISNNKPAKTLHVEWGWMELFAETSTSQSWIIAPGKHQTHDIIALLFCGKKKKGGTIICGYLIYCLPQKRVLFARVAQFLEGVGLKQDSVCSFNLRPDSVA